jgi:hypothetical protein
MRKTLRAVALAIPTALMAVSTIAAIPAGRLQVPAHPWAAQACSLSQELADEIFLPAPEVAPPPFIAAFYGVCSVTCAECYGPRDCPPDPDTGAHQYCTYACN